MIFQLIHELGHFNSVILNNLLIFELIRETLMNDRYLGVRAVIQKKFSEFGRNRSFKFWWKHFQDPFFHFCVLIGRLTSHSIPVKSVLLVRFYWQCPNKNQIELHNQKVVAFSKQTAIWLHLYHVPTTCHIYANWKYPQFLSSLNKKECFVFRPQPSFEC